MAFFYPKRLFYPKWLYFPTFQNSSERDLMLPLNIFRWFEIGSMVFFGPLSPLMCSLMKWKIAWTHIFNLLLGLSWGFFDYLFISLKLRIGQIDEDFFESFILIWALYISAFCSSGKICNLNYFCQNN